MVPYSSPNRRPISVEYMGYINRSTNERKYYCTMWLTTQFGTDSITMYTSGSTQFCGAAVALDIDVKQLGRLISVCKSMKGRIHVTVYDQNSPSFEVVRTIDRDWSEGKLPVAHPRTK